MLNKATVVLEIKTGVWIYLVSCRLDDGSGNTLGAIAFQAGGNILGDALMKAQDGQKMHVLGRIRRDHFRGGRAMQLEIEDVAPAQF